MNIPRVPISKIPKKLITALIGILLGLILATGLIAVYFRKNGEKFMYYMKFIAVLLIGGVFGYFLRYSTHDCEVQKVPVKEEVIIDTCLTLVKKCEISHEDSVAIYNSIRKARQKTRVKRIEKKDTTETKTVIPPDSIEFRMNFNKNYDWGLLRLGINIDAVSSCPVYFENYELNYELDTLEIKERYTTTNTIVLEPEQKVRTVEKYITIPDKRTKIYGGAGVEYDSRIRPVISTGFSTGNTIALLQYTPPYKDIMPATMQVGIITPIFTFK